MFDTMTVTKTAGAVLGALLILLLGNWAATAIYTVGGHGEASYVIDTGAAEEPAAKVPAAEEPATQAASAEVPATEVPATGEPATEEPATEEPAAEEPAAEVPAAEATAIAGDAVAGEKVFKKCKACHKVEDGKNAVGPYLYKVVGRPVASVEGFKYSSALTGLGGAWTTDRLDAFLTKPSDYAKGTKMTFPGLAKPEDRADVIAYLNSLGG